MAASAALAQTEFSAVIVDTGRSDSQPRAKIYMAKDKMRVESMADSGNKAAMSRGMGAIIMDLSAQTFTVLMDQQHMYMEMPAQAAEQRGMYHFFRSGDVDNACADWVQQVRNKGGTCQKVGSDTVNGRSTVKYQATNSKGESGYFWLDPKLRFPVKWQDHDGSGELRDIQEGAQPSGLFEIPAGYIKMDMGNMMQRPH
jgi:hypothetical protein